MSQDQLKVVFSYLPLCVDVKEQRPHDGNRRKDSSLLIDFRETRSEEAPEFIFVPVSTPLRISRGSGPDRIRTCDPALIKRML